MNVIVISGNLVRDPEFLPEVGANKTALCKFTVAVNRIGSDQADFIPITVWGRQAETCSQYLAKGRPVMVSGSIRLEPYEDKEGIKRLSVSLNANNVEFGPRNSDAAKSTVPHADADEDVPF